MGFIPIFRYSNFFYPSPTPPTRCQNLLGENEQLKRALSPIRFPISSIDEITKQGPIKIPKVFRKFVSFESAAAGAVRDYKYEDVRKCAPFVFLSDAGF